MSDPKENATRGSESDHSEGVEPMEENVEAVLVYQQIGPPISPIGSEIHSPSGSGDPQSEDDVSRPSTSSAVATRSGDTDEIEKSPDAAMDVSDPDESLHKPSTSKGTASETRKGSGALSFAASEEDITSGSRESSDPSGESLMASQALSTPSVDELSNFSDISISERSRSTDVSSIPTDGEDETSNASNVSMAVIPPEAFIPFAAREDETSNASNASMAVIPAVAFIPIAPGEDESSSASNVSMAVIPIAAREEESQDSRDSGMSTDDDPLRQQMLVSEPVSSELNECLSDECFSACNVMSFASPDIHVPPQQVPAETPILRDMLTRPPALREEESLQIGDPPSDSNLPTFTSQTPVLSELLARPSPHLQDNLPSASLPSDPSNVETNLTDSSKLAQANADSEARKSKTQGSETPPQETSPLKSRKDSPLLRRLLSQESDSPEKTEKENVEASEGGKSAESDISSKQSTDVEGVNEGESADKKATKRCVTEDEKTGGTVGVVAVEEGSPTKKPSKKCNEPALYEPTPIMPKDSKGSEGDKSFQPAESESSEQKPVVLSPTKKASKRGITEDIDPEASTSTVKTDVVSAQLKVPSDVPKEESEEAEALSAVASPTKKLRQSAPVVAKESADVVDAAVPPLSSKAGGTSESSATKKERSVRTPRGARTQVQTPTSDRITRSKLKEMEKRDEK